VHSFSDQQAGKSAFLLIPFLAFAFDVEFVQGRCVSRHNITLPTVARNAVPAIFGTRDYAEAGGLASYGPDYAIAYREAGAYVGRILQGAKPADLPVVQLSKIELVINAKTAKEFGLTIPPSLMVRADEVIE
jgi:putative ABC transport system substrate-binding protein